MSQTESIAIQMELEVMGILSQQELSVKELAEFLPYTYNQMKYTVQALRDAECIYRVPGSHCMALADV